MFNDLIGLSYGWGKRPGDGSNQTDCFQLMCEARIRLGLSDYKNRFEWVYEKYTESSLPPGRIFRWVIQSATECDLRPGATLVLPGVRAGALATATDYGILLIGPGGRVIQVGELLTKVRSYWLKD
jgi:hypothetical protein